MLITSTLLLAAGLTSLAGASDVSSTSAPTAGVTPSEASIEVEYDVNNENAAHDPLQMGGMDPSESPRHRQEKAHLMKRMDRKTGKWDRIHPRNRLLEALYGFTKYRERNMVELEKWRSMYRNVGKAQKKARFTVTF